LRSRDDDWRRRERFADTDRDRDFSADRSFLILFSSGERDFDRDGLRFLFVSFDRDRFFECDRDRDLLTDFRLFFVRDFDRDFDRDRDFSFFTSGERDFDRDADRDLSLRFLSRESERPRRPPRLRDRDREYDRRPPRLRDRDRRRLRERDRDREELGEREPLRPTFGMDSRIRRPLRSSPSNFLIARCISSRRRKQISPRLRPLLSLASAQVTSPTLSNSFLKSIQVTVLLKFSISIM